MKKFTISLLLFAVIGLVGTTSVVAATGYGHDNEISVVGGRVRSECYNPAAYSMAKCQTNNRAIQVKLVDSSQKVFTISSVGNNANWAVVGSNNAGTNFEHTHFYTSLALSR